MKYYLINEIIGPWKSTCNWYWNCNDS